MVKTFPRWPWRRWRWRTLRTPQHIKNWWKRGKGENCWILNKNSGDGSCSGVTKWSQWLCRITETYYNRWHLRFWSLWTVFTLCCQLSWLPSWLRSVVMDPCFIHSHILHEKILFTALKQHQTALWIVNALLFLIDCEQSRYPLQTEHSHDQMFMQNNQYILSKRYRELVNKTQTIYYSSKFIFSPLK